MFWPLLVNYSLQTRDTHAFTPPFATLHVYVYNEWMKVSGKNNNQDHKPSLMYVQFLHHTTNIKL